MEHKTKKVKTHNALKDILNVRHRNAGPTCDLKSKKAQRERNDKIHKLVEYASFGDLKGM